MAKPLRSKFELVCEGAGKVGCVLVRFPLAEILEIQEWIDENIPNDVIITPEHEQHITVFYGLNPGIDQELLKRYLDSTPPIVIQLLSIGLFKNEDKDVVKIDVKSPQLVQMNKEIAELYGPENIQPSEYDYNPHVTLAYVIPGAADHLEGHDRFKGYVYRLKDVIYSEPGSVRKVDFVLSN